MSFYEDDHIRLIHADCVDAMADMDPDSVDAIVTDPPYGLEFMGKDWDRLGDIGKTSHAHQARIMQDWHYRWAGAAFRIAKPGAHMIEKEREYLEIAVRRMAQKGLF